MNHKKGKERGKGKKIMKDALKEKGMSLERT
jgi:hypothetical protein